LSKNIPIAGGPQPHVLQQQQIILQPQQQIVDLQHNVENAAEVVDEHMGEQQGGVEEKKNMASMAAVGGAAVSAAG